MARKPEKDCDVVGEFVPRIEADRAEPPHELRHQVRALEALLAEEMHPDVGRRSRRHEERTHVGLLEKLGGQLGDVPREGREVDPGGG